MDTRAAALVLALGLVSAPVAAAAAPATADAAAVKIDAAKTGTPISPFVYGQFIEHLGRCIYGGLWAEMLEDRKFFYPVTGDAPAWEMFKPGPRSYDGEGYPYELLVRSPWVVIGERGAVTMVKEGALAGEHSPAVRLDLQQPRGLMQERLALRDGHEYVGRVALAGGAGPVSVSLVWGGGATMRQTVTIGAIGSEWTTHPLRFRAGGTTDNGRLEITAQGDGTLRIGAVSLMPADNVLGWRRDTMARLRELDAPGLPLAGRQLRLRLRLEGRHRRSRPPAAAEEPGVEGRRGERRRSPRVHGPHGHDRRRAVRGRQHRPRRLALGRRARRVRERRAVDPHGEGARQERPHPAVRHPPVGSGQRDVRRLAARPHAALEVRREAQGGRRRDAGQGPEDPARRRGLARRVDRRRCSPRPRPT